MCDELTVGNAELRAPTCQYLYFFTSKASKLLCDELAVSNAQLRAHHVSVFVLLY